LSRYAIGDVQGCLEPLQQLLRRLRFSADRDELVFAGDLVNRGPESLAVLRLVRSLGDNARTVLGNHDLHLLAHHFDPARPLRPGDTLEQVLGAPDREPLMDWLLQQPLLIHDKKRNDLFVHAGLIPQWSAPQAQALAVETEQALRATPREFLARMYGNQPDLWRDDLEGADRLRFITNALTRLRVCERDGRMLLKFKGAPGKIPAGAMPWFRVPGRRSAGARIVCGHWSALGYRDEAGVLALDTGCVWGGTLTAQRIDVASVPVAVPNRSGALPIDGD